MSSTFKTFLSNDVVPTRTLLHEAIPITGTVVSGTYSDLNIKNYSHGLFQSVYDYPYLSSSANHIFDITVGYSANSALSSSTSNQNSKKINIYNQMAQMLVGYDATGSIMKFDENGDLSEGTKLKECIFLNFSRLLTKDEVKKGSFSLVFGGTQAYATPFTSNFTVTDAGATTSYKTNSPAGEYGILKVGSNSCGLLFYQAGVAVLTSSVFLSAINGVSNCYMNSSNELINAVISGSAITGSADAIRHRIYNLSFNNTTELNSTVYFCRVNNNDFNYSSNPTYLSSSQIVVKNTNSDAPISYITTVGLYSADNELLAVAKLSEPLKKDPTNELTIRVRLDY